MLEFVFLFVLKVFLGVCIALLILIALAWLVDKSRGEDGDKGDAEDV